MKKDLDLKETLDYEVSFCPDCRCKRRRVDPIIVPVDLKKQAQDLAKDPGIEINYYLYCPKCNEYAVIYSVIDDNEFPI